jgi:mannosyltransferase
VAALIVLAAALRFPTLTQQSYWFDEAGTAGLVRSSLRDLLSTLAESESSPPIYFLLAWVWTHLLGSGEAGLRSLSAVAGLVTVGVVFAAAKSLISTRAGLVAAGLVACSPTLVWYSQEARAYALMACLAAVSILLFVRARQRPSPGRLGAWAGVSALALATHYFAAFLVVGEAVLLWTALPKSRRALTVAFAGIVAVGAALLPLAVHQANTGKTSWIGEESLVARIESVVGSLVSSNAGISPRWSEVGGVVALFALTVVVVAVIVLGRRLDPGERAGVRLAGTLGGFVLLAPLALALAGVDFLLARNLLAAWVALAIALGGLLGARRAGRWGALAAAAVCMAGIAAVLEVIVRPDLQRTDWRAAARALGPPVRARAVVVYPDWSTPALRVYGQSLLRFPRGRLPLREIVLIRKLNESSSRPVPPILSVTVPPGFSLAQRLRTRSLILLRYTSSLPRPVTTEQLKQPLTKKQRKRGSRWGIRYQPPDQHR